MRWLAVLTAVSAVFTHALTLRAQVEPLMLLELEHCDDLDEAEVRRITAAELGAAAASTRGPGVTEVTVTCEGARVIVLVRDPLTMKGVQRSFDLRLSDPRSRSRLVSIAATELVLASWSELETNPKPHVEPEGAPSHEPAVKAARKLAKERVSTEAYEPHFRNWYDADTPEDRMFRIVALASMRAFFDVPGTLWGGGLRVGEQRFRFLSWSADVLFEQGTLGNSTAAYNVFTTTLGGCLFVSGQSGPITGRLGAGLRLGFAASSPNNTNAAPDARRQGGDSTLAPWGWPLGAASVSFRLAYNMVIDVSGEAGYVVLPTFDSGHDLRGGWFSGQLGIGYIPGGRPSPAPAAAVEE